MPDVDSVDHAGEETAAPEDGAGDFQADAPDAESLATEGGAAGWEACLDAAADELLPQNPPGTGWYRTGIMCALTGLIFPLFFGPAAVMMGLAARERKHPRALVPIVLGVLVTIYGAVYYWIAVRGTPA